MCSTKRCLSTRLVLAAAAIASIAPAQADSEASAPPVLVAQASADDAMWNIIRDSSSTSVFEAFIQSYPNSRHVADARARLAALGKSVPANPGGASPDSRDQVTVFLGQIESGLTLVEASIRPTLAKCTAIETSINAATSEVARAQRNADAFLTQANSHRDKLGRAETAKALGDLGDAAATIMTARQRATQARQAACLIGSGIMLAPGDAAAAGRLAEAERSLTLAEQQARAAAAALSRAQPILATPPSAGAAAVPGFIDQLDLLCTEVATIQDAFESARLEAAEVRAFLEPFTAIDPFIAQIRDPKVVQTNPNMQPYAARLQAIVARYDKLDQRRECSPAIEASIATADSALPTVTQRCWQAQATSVVGLAGSSARMQALLQTLKRNVDDIGRIAANAGDCVAAARKATGAR